jgi:hypothetical protein
MLIPLDPKGGNGMDPPKAPYLSFLIRLWQVSRGDERIWHLTLDNPHTRQHWNFASLEELKAFLQEQMEQLAQERKEA